MARVGITRPIVWISLPDLRELAWSLEAQLRVYHVVDEYAAYDGLSESGRVRLRQLEEKLLRAVDGVFVVSENLLKRKREFNPRTYLVPHGVDFELFSKVHNQGTSKPLSHLSSPIIGYAGLISARLDLELLRYISTNRPNWTLVLVGQVDDRFCKRELEALKLQPNVCWVGTRSVAELPGYLSRFDVCLIPYRPGESADCSCPLKLFEYAALGKPVVATNFAAARGFGNWVTVADSREEYLSAIQSTLSWPTTDERRLAALEKAEANRWSHRVLEVSKLLGDLLEMKEHGWHGESRSGGARLR
jgi:glycosyltransferase involved in cell wall biosynthesis